MVKYFVVCIGISLINSITTQVLAAENAKTEIVVKAPIGSGDGQIGYESFSKDAWVEPTALTIDSKGNIYVADILNERIQKFGVDGKFKLTIKVTTPQKRSNEYVNDIAVDNDDNLYVLIKNARLIYKFSAKGELVQTITYDTLLNAEKISIDSEGQIYLHSDIVNGLHKLSKKGAIEKSWNNVASFLLDVDGNLFVSSNTVSWEKYDKNGKLIGTTACDKEDLKVYFPLTEGGGCHFPPQFIHKNGGRYFLKTEEKPTKMTSVLIFDRTGKFIKKITMPFSADMYPQSNLVKFGSDGNFYTEYGYIQEGFQVMRIKLQ